MAVGFSWAAVAGIPLVWWLWPDGPAVGGLELLGLITGLGFLAQWLSRIEVANGRSGIVKAGLGGQVRAPAGEYVNQADQCQCGAHQKQRGKADVGG